MGVVKCFVILSMGELKLFYPTYRVPTKNLKKVPRLFPGPGKINFPDHFRHFVRSFPWNMK